MEWYLTLIFYMNLKLKFNQSFADAAIYVLKNPLASIFFDKF